MYLSLAYQFFGKDGHDNLLVFTGKGKAITLCGTLTGN